MSRVQWLASLAPRPSFLVGIRGCNTRLFGAKSRSWILASYSRQTLVSRVEESRELARGGEINRAAQLASTLLEEIEHQEEAADAGIYDGLIDIFSRSKRLDKANRVLQEMNKRGVQPSLATYTSAVLAANRPHTIATAEAIYDKLVDEGVALDAPFYDAYISALIGARNFRRAHQIYFHMSKRNKLPASMITYKNLITIYGESKRWDLVQKVLRKMANRNMPPESVHYRAAILAAAKAEGIDQAFSWVEQLEANRGKYPALNEGAYNALIEACCLDANSVDKSWRALRIMKKAGIKPSSRSYNAVLAGYAKYGRSHEIGAVLEEMSRDGVEKDSYTYALLVEAYAKSTDLTKAFDWYREYKAAGFAPRHDIYNHLLNGLRQQVVLQDLTDGSSSGSIEATQATATAESLFKEMKENDVQLSVRTYHNLIEAYHLTRQNQKAFDLYDSMKRQGVRPHKPLVQLMGALVAQELASLEAIGQL